MMNPEDKRLIAVVAQQPFDIGPSRFCKLVPWMYVDSESVDPSDFANDGEVWWMLTSTKEPLAKVGKLISLQIEQAPQFRADDAHSSQFQALRESPRELELTEGAEVIRVPTAELSHIENLTDGNTQIHIAHPPTRFIIIEWSGYMYGPLVIQGRVKDSVPGRYLVSVGTTNSDQIVLKMASDRFKTLCAGFLRENLFSLSADSQTRYSTTRSITFTYEFLLPQGTDAFLSGTQERLSLEPLDHAFMRQARSCLTRPQRRELKELLKAVKENSNRAEDQQELLKRLEQIEDLTERQGMAFDQFVQKLLVSGLLGEERIELAERRLSREYIESHTAELQAEIEVKISSLRKELRDVEGQYRVQRQQLQDELEAEKRQIEAEFQEERTRELDAWKNEKRQIETERQRIEDEKESFQKSLEDAANYLSQSSDKVVTQFLAMAPLLRRFQLLQKADNNNGGNVIPEETSEGSPRKFEPVQFEIPSTILIPRSAGEEEADEMRFLTDCAAI